MQNAELIDNNYSVIPKSRHYPRSGRPRPYKPSLLGKGDQRSWWMRSDPETTDYPCKSLYLQAVRDRRSLAKNYSLRALYIPLGMTNKRGRQTKNGREICRFFVIIQFCILHYNDHLIRQPAASRLAAARSQNGSGVINTIHYRSAASLPQQGRLILHSAFCIPSSPYLAVIHQNIPAQL